MFSYTDCAYTHKKKVPTMEGYNMHLKEHLEWTAIYNQQRVLSMTKDGKIHRVHFNKPMRIKLFEYLEEIIDQKLREDAEAFLKNPDLKIDLRKLKKENPDLFKVVVFKKNDICRDINYLEIWGDLVYGLNNVYLSKDGVTTDPKKILVTKYRKFTDSYLKLYRGLRI
jgi:hypothetical protein